MTRDSQAVQGSGVREAGPARFPFQRRLARLRARVVALRASDEGDDPRRGRPHSKEIDAIALDLEELASAQEAADQELNRYRDLFRLAPHGYVVTDPSGMITQANPASLDLFGGARARVVGKNLVAFVARGSRNAFHDSMVRVSEKGEPAEWEVLMRQNGQAFVARIAVAGALDPGGEVRALHWMLQDVTQRKKEEELLIYRANHDQLTGLANRGLFGEGLELALARARRNSSGVAVLSLDLDKFKLVNDSLGHAAGDEVLRQVAQRLSGVARATDIAARVGGDEFMVLLADLDLDGNDNPSNPFRAPGLVASRMAQAMRAPCLVEGIEVHISASIGVALYPRDSQDKVGLLHRADAEMYRTKEMGKGGYVLIAGDGETAAALGERLQVLLAESSSPTSGS